MKIKSVEFAGAVGAPGGKQPSGALAQVAFSGRSNVGKSSLINRLLGRTRTAVARVSSTPGKTREINFFRVVAAGESGSGELRFFAVDLPGYGFARVPLELRSRWRPMIESYVEGTASLRGVVQLIDARHPPSADDLKMVEYLAAVGKPALFALTKVDKLGRAERARRIEQLMKQLGAEPEQVVPFSAVTGEGREELLAALEAILTETTEAP